MNITHPSGEAYDLLPGTELEITRFNPFFHDLGEQSVPVALPPTDKNMRLMGYPHRLDNAVKVPSRIDAVINSGVYSVVARQAILSAKKGDSVQSSFYLNEGAFYEKIEDLTLSEIFADKKVQFSDIDAAIAFMTGLITTDDPRFAVFEVLTDNYALNEISSYSGGAYFIKERETEEIIDESRITVPKGFYITPFVKVRHVLEEVLSHLGYQLGSSLLDQPPFNGMVFLNDTIDTIVEASINYVDVVPNITVKTLFNILRKFNLELFPDEINRIVHLVSFDQEYNNSPSADISQHVVSSPLVDYSRGYSQVKLISEQLSLPSTLSRLVYLSGKNTTRIEQKVGATDTGSLTLFEVVNQFPTVYVDNAESALVRDGVRGDRIITERIAPLSMPYYDGGPIPVEEYSFPDVVPAFYGLAPYVGRGRTLQSKIELQQSPTDGEDVEDLQDESSSPEELKAMLCLYYRKNGNCIGTLYNYDYEGNLLWDHAITWYGAAGIFEKFWRSRDTLMRNALLPVEVEVILPEQLKVTLPSTRRVSFNGQNYLLSQLQYTTKERSPSMCSLFSTKIQNPVSQARASSSILRDRKYKWILRRTYSVTGAPGRPLTYRFASEPVAFYPPDPTDHQYAAGGQYYSRTYTVEYGSVGNDGVFSKIGDCNMTAWLEPELA